MEYTNRIRITVNVKIKSDKNNRIRKTMEFTNREIQTDKNNRVRKTMEYTKCEIQTDKKNHAIYKPY